MEIKRCSIPLIFLLAFLLLLPLYGCGGGDGEEQEQPAGGSSSDEEVTIDDLFGKAKEIDGISYDYVMTEGSTGQTLEGKVWMEGKKTRMEMTSEEGQLVQLVDMETSKAYSYMPDTKTAYELDLSEVESADTPKDYVDNTDTSGAEFLGKEDVNGVSCYKWSVKAKENEDAKVTMWLHSEYGFPVKIETVIDEVSSILEYKNIKVGDVSDDLFTLPQGTQVQSMSDLMQNLPAAP